MKNNFLWQRIKQYAVYFVFFILAEDRFVFNRENQLNWHIVLYIAVRTKIKSITEHFSYIP